MIEWIRKHMGWLMWVIVILTTVTFMFFGIYPSAISGRTAAKVGGVIISTGDVNRAYENMLDQYRDIFKGDIPDTIRKSLRNEALQQLIGNELLVQEAKRIGLRVSDEELEQSIMRMQSFTRNGVFDRRVYEMILARAELKPAAFESSQRQALLRQKLVDLIKDGVQVTDAEVRAAYAKRHPKAKPGAFAKDKEKFTQDYLASKQQDALTAYLRTIESRTKVQIHGQGQTS